METANLSELDTQKRSKAIRKNAFENKIAPPLSDEMDALKRIGRMIGVLVLVQLACGVLVNFVLIPPVISPPGYLVNAAANSLQASLAALILPGAGALGVGIAIAALPVFRQYSHAMALWFLALAVVNFSLVAVQSTTVLSMLSLSQAYAKADAADAALFQTLQVVVRSAWKWAFNMNLIVAFGWLFVLYSGLYRFVLIPRALAAFGLGSVMLMLIEVTMSLFGSPGSVLMHMPSALSQLALAAWLMAKGFEERQQSASIGRE